MNFYSTFQQNNLSSQSGSNVGQRRRLTHFDAAKTMLIIILAFILAWSPFAIVALIGQFGPKHVISPLAATIPSIFAKSSSAYNPIIYAFRDRLMRNSIDSQFFRCIWRKKTKSNRSRSRSRSGIRDQLLQNPAQL